MSRPSGVEKEAVNVRLPQILVGRMRTACKAQGIAFTEFVEAAIRAKLDGSPAAPPRAEVHDKQNGKSKASELVERFGGLGVTTAAHLQETAKINEAFDPVFVGNCPVEDVPRRNWVKN